MKNMKIIKESLLSLDGLLRGTLGCPIKKLLLSHIINKNNFKKFPIYIISYNRLDYLSQTIEWLEKNGYTNIVIIDNKSTYKPLLDYYKTCKFKIAFMKKNWGHNVFYKAPRFFIKSRFTFHILTDPDLLPVDECPSDFVEVFTRVMMTYPDVSKVGFSLKINDLPDEYYLKDEVLRWESKFYSCPIDNELFSCKLYNANIDTTFAVNSPLFLRPFRNKYKGIRTGFPYQARHLPWYNISLSDEERNYIKTIRKDVSNWNGNITKEQMNKRIEKHSKN